MAMTQLTYQVRFTTPAFLGNAEQSAQWRTPPFKALLRHWWRVAWSAAHGVPTVQDLHRAEAALFGAAADGEGHRSRLRLRLDRWSHGTVRRWEALPTVTHPEVRFPVDSGLYLGYGPLDMSRGEKTPGLKRNAAIQAGEVAMLRVACPDEHAEVVRSAFWLMDRYGALGGRSRNGWGSLSLTAQGESPALEGMPPTRPWQDALGLEWPHALGIDASGPLVWELGPCADWRQLMHRLAEVKIGLRTQFPFPDERTPHDQPRERHWLAYPVTKHGVKAWRTKRLPNSLRFKARPIQDGRLTGVIFHIPCKPPREFRPDQGVIERVWRRVHEYLDETKGVQRAPA